MDEQYCSSELRDIPNYGDMMMLEDFISACRLFCFIDYDGHGFLATATKMSNIPISPSQYREYKDYDGPFRYVIWFNK